MPWWGIGKELKFFSGDPGLDLRPGERHLVHDSAKEEREVMQMDYGLVYGKRKRSGRKSSGATSAKQMRSNADSIARKIQASEKKFAKRVL